MSVKGKKLLGNFIAKSREFIRILRVPSLFNFAEKPLRKENETSLGLAFSKVEISKSQMIFVHHNILEQFF